MATEVSNHSSALGEAVGALMENALHRQLKPLVEEQGCVFVTAGQKNLKNNRSTKLLLTDENGVSYQIDAVVANTQLQPLILMEFKYIRYTKHNRDKGSWVCNTHQQLRRRFSSIRGSVTVLAGRWSAPSKAMMRGADVSLFEIPFDTISSILSRHDVDFNWDEKDRETPRHSWQKFCEISEEDLIGIGNEMIEAILPSIQKHFENILDENIPRSIIEVEVQFSTNLGEAKFFKFDTVGEALTFLEGIDSDHEEILAAEGSPTIFDSIDSPKD